jgi:hypothetical protein
MQTNIHNVTLTGLPKKKGSAFDLWQPKKIDIKSLTNNNVMFGLSYRKKALP